MKIQDALSVAAPSGKVAKGAPGNPCDDFGQALKNSVEEMERLIREADQGVREMLLGEADLHQTMIAIEKANLSLRLMLQVRNKMISAYEEIMRMQF